MGFTGEMSGNYFCCPETLLAYKLKDKNDLLSDDIRLFFFLIENCFCMHYSTINIPGALLPWGVEMNIPANKVLINLQNMHPSIVFSGGCSVKKLC